MKFADFQRFEPPGCANVYAFLCEDDLLLEESKPIWSRIFGGRWAFEKYPAKEFEAFESGRLFEYALTPPLLIERRAIIVTEPQKLSENRLSDLTAIDRIDDSSLKLVLHSRDRRSRGSWTRRFPAIEIAALKPAEIVRWLGDRYGLDPKVGRYMVDHLGTDLCTLRSEVEKLAAYANNRPIRIRDVDVLVFRAERFGTFELDDALAARNYARSVQVAGAMLDEGTEPILVLSRITRVWRQLMVGKSLEGRAGARDIAAAASVPEWKAASFASSASTYAWPRLLNGFQELLDADRVLKTSTPDPHGYFALLLWKLAG